ncbi:DDE-type integrase/transposase/recombinase [Amycolatopsis methanolica]|uniref:DDE-type integrase/transposase/recombinase n=1 Tax=Amycolatopsis methanolica TaxID=1814 RepID=UPI003414E52A
MNRLPASRRYERHQQRWKRYEKQRPGHHVQIDVKFIEPITTGTAKRKRYYQYTAMDDCTRLRVLRICPRSDQKTAIQFLDYVPSRLPFQVEKIQSDNGAEFQPAFHWHVLDKGIGHLHPPGHTPAQRQGRALPPHRHRRVLPSPRRRGHRRRGGVQRQAQGMGRTTTTTTDPTAASAAKPPMRGCYRSPKPSLSPATVSSTPRRLHCCGSYLGGKRTKGLLLTRPGIARQL